MGLVALCTGSPGSDHMDLMFSKFNDWQPKWDLEQGRKSARLATGTEIPVDRGVGSKAFDTVICRIVEPTEEELSLVPMLQC